MLSAWKNDFSVDNIKVKDSFFAVISWPRCHGGDGPCVVLRCLKRSQ